ncbi:deoxynucleoside kinase [Candidatus Woesebacteria bacterium]|nr:deoxynucleoside kinase [Candidatus Woesebacteria bacterium]
MGYPYLRKQNKEEGIRIEVMADSMRVGKTTAVKVIAEGLRSKGMVVTESYEDWQHNPYLTKSYEDPERNFLESQKWFIKRKWQQVKEGGVGVYIQDVAPEMDYCYAETNRRLSRMSEEHFSEYETYFESLDWTVAPAPSLLIYLSVSDEELIQRAMDSRREFETVEPEYFLMMKRVNREWLTGAKNHRDYKIIEVDTDHLDFANNQLAKTELVERVINATRA